MSTFDEQINYLEDEVSSCQSLLSYCKELTIGERSELRSKIKGDREEIKRLKSKMQKTVNA